MVALRHFTHPSRLNKIFSDGLIKLEGHIYYDNTLKDFAFSQQVEFVQFSYDLIGRYVWFTEAETLLCNDYQQHEMASLIFDADEIGAKRWSIFKKRFAYHQKKWKLIQSLDNTTDDNTDDWWICLEPVTVDHNTVLELPLNGSKRERTRLGDYLRFAEAA